MASAFYCDPCGRRDKTSTAIKFCSDCDDKLCLECLDVHKTLKSCISHHVIDVTVTNEPFFTVNKFCEKHANLTLELYCSDHDVICCRSCMVDDHRACGKLTPIEIASMDIKSSNIFEEISKQADNLKEASSQMTNGVQKSKQLLNESKVASIEKLSKFKEKLHNHIDELASESLLKINKLYSELSDKEYMNETEIAKRVQIIQDILTKFDSVATHGSDKQIFLLLNSIKPDIYKTEAGLEEFLPTLKTTAVEFKESDPMTSLKFLGCIKAKESSCDIKFKPVKQQQAQLNVKASSATVIFQLEQKVTFANKKNMWITGMCVPKDNQLIVCNWKAEAKELIVLTNQGQFIESINLTSRPWNIAIEPGTTDAWVTYPNASFLQIIDTRSLTFKRQVDVSEKYYGIAFVGCNIALGSNGKVDIINKQGGCLKSLEVGTNNIYAMCYTGNNKLYCCEAAGKNKFHCVTLEGTIVFSYSSADLRGPICVNADHQGNVYVLCCRSNNLHKLTADGKLLDVVLHKKDELNSPFAASFDANLSKLFIANDTTKELLIFSCK